MGVMLPAIQTLSSASESNVLAVSRLYRTHRSIENGEVVDLSARHSLNFDKDRLLLGEYEEVADDPECQLHRLVWEKDVFKFPATFTPH